MVKLIAFFKRKAGMSVDEFGRHWRTAHAELLVQNREEEIQDYLVQTGIPTSRIASNLEWLDLPRSRFDFDPIVVLSSVAVESMFVNRIVRLRFLEDAYRTAFAHVSETIRLLRSGLD